jgi:hypothetical protein
MPVRAVSSRLLTGGAVLALAVHAAHGQGMIFNASFEDTAAAGSRFNLTNDEFNALMADATAFGDSFGAGEVDIMLGGAGFGDAPVYGQWKIGLAHDGGAEGVDAIALGVFEPILAGRTYDLTLVAQSVITADLAAVPLEIGVSSRPDDFGRLVLATGTIGGSGWSHLALSFVAPAGGEYLTIRGTAVRDGWTHIDAVFLSPTCRVDIDGDGALSIFDFLAFQNAFEAGDRAVDLDGDGRATIFDFLVFQNEFQAGCE